MFENNNKVSIITPLYNAERFINDAAEGVLSQTYPDFEWLIVNDSSTDNSMHILEKIAQKDSRIKVIHLPENMGPIIARNRAMELAAGRYIAFLDADDIWLPKKLELQLELMKNTNMALSCTRYKKINKDGSLRTGITVPVPSRAAYGRVLRSDSIMASSAVFDRALTGEIRMSYDAPIGRDDYHFFLSILKIHKTVYCVNEDLARLRVFGDTLTGNKLKSARLQWRFYRGILSLPFPSAAEKFAVYAVKGFCKFLL